MSALPSLRPELALGFDAVLAFDPARYAVEYDDLGWSHAFAMGDGIREHLVDAVRAAVPPTAPTAGQEDTGSGWVVQLYAMWRTYKRLRRYC